jgi:protein TonB
MEQNKILSADLLDILFEGKNKSYGAYELRRSYNKRLVVSIAVMLTAILLLWGGYLLANKNDHQLAVASPFPIADSVVVKIIEQPRPELPPLPPPPPPPALPAEPQVNTLAFTSPPRIVNTDVPDSEKPPTTDDMEHARIGTVNTPGVDGGEELMPPAPSGTGNGVIAEPTKEKGNGDDEFVPVEIEASYPGGLTAWTRFLIKNLSNTYPQDAIDQGIQGPVVIQFIVDKEGNVSDIQAVSGPNELRDAAIRVIKKSGKWIPAEQNGRKVKSYKRQPIVFKLQE